MIKFPRIFFDVDTQHDFMNKQGALYVPDAVEIKPNLGRLTKHAYNNHLFVIGSLDTHFATEEYKERESELKCWGGLFPNHCIKGTTGQSKIRETQLGYGSYIFSHTFPRQIPFAIEEEVVRWLHELDILDKWQVSNGIYEDIHNRFEFLRTGVDSYRIAEAIYSHEKSRFEGRNSGIYFEKQSYDVFTNPNCEALLKKADVKEAVVYGVATDYCVKAAVLGMQKRGIQCYVVGDAIAAVAPDTNISALEEMLNAGAKFVKTKDVLDGKL
jgi:nicotinamidase/pyrazinamidase